MNKNNNRSAYHCEVELLTPVHIGNGDKYVENFDFFYENNTKKILVFDRNELLRQVSDAGDNTILSFTQAIEEKNLAAWLRNKQNNVDIGSARIHSFGHDRKPRDILVQLRSGMGDALLAGSSLKGAFRTAVLARLSQEEKRRSVVQFKRDFESINKINLKFADSRISKNLLGPDAQKNLMRSLSVADCAFPADTIKLQSVVLSRLVNNNRMAIKFGTVVEKIAEGTRANCQISFDKYLARYGQVKMGFRTELTLEWLLDAIRQKTYKTIATEQEFLNGVDGDNVQMLRVFYEQLQNKVENLAQNEVVLQLAWGSGWNGMTGELLEKEDLTDRLRTKLKLAPDYLQFPFPKSRRFAVTNGQAVPMGWVKLAFLDKEEFRARKAEKLKKQQREQAEKKFLEESNKEKKEKWKNMDEIEQAVAVIQGSELALSQAPEKDPIRDIWSILENVELEERKKLAYAFVQEWQKYPDSWRKKQSSSGQWEKIKKVVEITGLEHPDILYVDADDQELIEQLGTFNDFGQFDKSSIDVKVISRSVGECLEVKLKDWGCDNKRAKETKKLIWAKLQRRLKELRKP